MEEKYKQFESFNWAGNQEWGQYWRNLFPTPPASKILRYKKKFYKLKIDDSFDIDYVPPTPEPEQPRTSAPHTHSHYNAYSGGFVARSKTLATLEFIVWNAFFGSLFAYSQYSLKLATLSCALKTFHRTGLPKFNVQYAQDLFFNEHFQLMLYSLLFMVDEFNYYLTLPLIITYLINVAEFACIELKAIKPIYDLTYPIHAKRVDLAQIRVKLMIAIGFLLVVGIFLGLNNFLIPIFYWQYIRFIYIMNNDFKTEFGHINALVEKVKNSDKLPGFVKIVIGQIQTFSNYIVRTESSSDGQAGASNCSIF